MRREMKLVNIMGRKISEETKEDIIQGARERIEQELEYINIKPYSSNIIGLRLASVARKCGKKTADGLIEEFGLETYGYHKGG
jgi:hypothetical protein